MVDNQSGHGIQILKGSILVKTEMGTSALNNMSTGILTIDMAKVGNNSYAEMADVRQFQMGMPGAFRPLQGNLVNGSGASVSDDKLTLSVVSIV